MKGEKKKIVQHHLSNILTDRNKKNRIPLLKEEQTQKKIKEQIVFLNKRIEEAKHTCEKSYFYLQIIINVLKFVQVYSCICF